MARLSTLTKCENTNQIITLISFSSTQRWWRSWSACSSSLWRWSAATASRSPTRWTRERSGTTTQDRYVQWLHPVWSMWDRLSVELSNPLVCTKQGNHSVERFSNALLCKLRGTKVDNNNGQGNFPNNHLLQIYPLSKHPTLYVPLYSYFASNADFWTSRPVRADCDSWAQNVCEWREDPVMCVRYKAPCLS